MSSNCKKCGMLKMTPGTKCACSPIKKAGAVEKKKKKPKAIKKVSDKKRKRLEEFGGEDEMNFKIFKGLEKKRKNKCLICGITVKQEEVQSGCFAHILPKGTYPEFRYFVNNIAFVCSISHHEEADNSVNLYKQDLGLFFLQDQIKNGKVPDLEPYIDHTK